MLTIKEAAERLDVQWLYLMHIIHVGDVRPSVCELYDGEVWHELSRFEFSADDLEAFRAEIERRRFPHVREQHGDVVETDARFACGPGWEQIIRSVATKLSALPGPPRISGGKEKFGSLTLYVFYDIILEEYDVKDISLRDAVEDIREAGRKKSVTICEECGEPGRLRMSYSRSKTTCDRHAHIVDYLHEDDGEIVDLPPQGGPTYKDGTQGTY